MIKIQKNMLAAFHKIDLEYSIIKHEARGNRAF